MVAQIYHMSKIDRLAKGTGHRLARKPIKAEKKDIKRWNEAHRALLEQHGVYIKEVSDRPLTESKKQPGPLEKTKSFAIALAGGLSAIGASFKARGSYLLLPLQVRNDPKRELPARLRLKSEADLTAIAAIAKSLRHIEDIEVVIGEGCIPKAGETRNVALPPGQQFAGSKYKAVVDPIDGTTKTIMGISSAITAIALLDQEVHKILELEMEKLIVCPGTPPVSLNLPYAQIIEAITQGRSIPTELVNMFMLDRQYHPVAQLVDEFGINLALDKDGDMIPTLAAMLGLGLLPNGQPLHGQGFGLQGWVEFMGTAIPAHWLGGQASIKLTSERGKALGWEHRGSFSAENEAQIQEIGLTPGGVYLIEDLVPGIKESDGAAAFGAITDDWYIPNHDGVIIGGDQAVVNVLVIGASGEALLRTIEFGFLKPRAEIENLFCPLLTQLSRMSMNNVADGISRMLSNEGTAQALQDEFRSAFHDLISMSEANRFIIDEARAATILGDNDIHLMQEIRRLAPNWF